LGQPFDDEIVNHIGQVHRGISIDDALQLLQLLGEVALAGLVAKESQLFNKVRPGHVRVLNDIFKSHLGLLLDRFL
jgi:predicted YcjX-like family ATPase